MKKVLTFAFPRTLPVLAGYFFLSLSYGILCSSLGLPVWLTLLMSLVVYAGSAQFLAAELLVAPFNPFATFIIIFLLNARHIFYGLALLEPINGLTFGKNYVRFAMTDETFSTLASTHRPKEIDRNWFYLHTSWLNHSYWFLGSIFGALAGSWITVDTTGIEFVLVALFLILFVENVLEASSSQWTPGLIGFGSSLVSLYLFGPDRFILPAMGLILLSFTVLYLQKERGQS